MDSNVNARMIAAESVAIAVKNGPGWSGPHGVKGS